MAETENQVELDLDDAQETEVGIIDERGSDDVDVSDDQFEKAETSTQKRISRLTKKMREAERREQEAIRYAQAIQSESGQLKQRMQNLDTNYVAEYTNRVSTQMQQAEAQLARAIEIGDSTATVADPSGRTLFTKLQKIIGGEGCRENGSFSKSERRFTH